MNCVDLEGTIVDDSLCTDERPPEVIECASTPCPGVTYVLFYNTYGEVRFHSNFTSILHNASQISTKITVCVYQIYGTHCWCQIDGRGRGRWRRGRKKKREEARRREIT